MLTTKIERRLAPFWRGINDHSSSWTEHQLVAIARGLPLPAADEIPPQEANEEEHRQSQQEEELGLSSAKEQDLSEQALHNLTIPIASRAQAHSYNSDSSANQVTAGQPNFAAHGLASSSSLLRGRSKTLASLSPSPKSVAFPDMQQKETQLPKDPNVNGQPLEAYIYKDAIDCPICFLYYPPYLNKTRCCNQAICSECFVQIKRPDPHPPEHADPSTPQRPQPDNPLNQESQLVSEPAACPFCVQPEFGVFYDPPPFRRGLVYVSGAPTQSLGKTDAAASSATSLDSTPSSADISPSRRRAISLAVNDPSVITTDKVRPDWAAKLASARAHNARRSAAATALHTAAYLMGGRNGGSESRFGFGRRGVLRRGNGGDSPSDGGSSSHLNMLAMMAERHRNAELGEETGRSDMRLEGSPSIVGPPRQSSRRNRIDDLEDMMMMEAIRLSLASEEERRKKEEKSAKKDAKKDAKKKAKEEKRAEKAARKTGLYPSSANQSSRTLESDQGLASQSQGKGKSAIRSGTYPPDIDTALARPGMSSNSNETAQSYLERSRAILQNDSPSSPNFPSMPPRPSHLRNLSNASSSASSIEQIKPATGSISSLEPSPNASGIHIAQADVSESTVSGTPPGGGAGVEPMFNFRSLAAMIDAEEKRTGDPIVEHGGDNVHLEHIASEQVEAGSSASSTHEDSLAHSIATLKPIDPHEDSVEESPPNEKVTAKNHTTPSALEG